MAEAPIPVAVLTGFLGAGKTTLLNFLLKDPFLANAAVVINEFGDIGLDHLLVETSNENVFEMSSGCLCCTIRGDLIDTLRDLLARRGRGEIKRFDRIIIETTGLADPAPVLHAVMSDPGLLSACRLEGVITVVDAFNGMATLDAHSEAVKQVAVADRIVLTKVDLLVGREGEEMLFAIIGRLRKLNPAARLLTTHRNEATAERLFTMGLFDPRTKTVDVQNGKWKSGPVAAHATITRSAAANEELWPTVRAVQRANFGNASFTMSSPGGEAAVREPWRVATALMAAMSATCPYRLTGMMARVFAVTLASISDASTLQVSGSMSTNTGFAPSSTMVSAVAAKVKGVVMTSSPGPMPSAIRAIKSASVPLATVMQCLAPV